MIKYISKRNNKNLILLVHGFVGGRDTWIEKNGDRIPKYLNKNEKINSNFDIAYFEYFTKITDKIEKIKYFFKLITSSKRKFKQNLSIDDIKDILSSHLEGEFKKYDKVVVIAHSMGGLISKAAILKLIKKENNQVVLFLSLCVPHNGSNLANLGKYILNNDNVTDLAPLSLIIDEISREWIDPKVVGSLPQTIYYQGKNDIIVSNQSSVGYEAREVKIVYSDDDHSSILSPSGSDTVVIESIINSIIDILKKKENTKKGLIRADISEESIDIIAKKISNKLGVSIPEFETLTITKDGIPQISTNISKRSVTIKNLLSESDKKWIAIYGMNDTGKTQLSVLVSKYLNLETVWINFKDCEKNTVIRKLFNSFDANTLDELEVNIQNRDPRKQILVVLDDLPKFGIDSFLDNLFNNVISLFLQKNIIIFSTSNHILTNSIRNIHNDSVNEREIPLLNKTECSEVIQTYPGSAEFIHKDLLHIITDGYPIYLQIICRFLEKTDWIIEKEQLLDFFTGNLFTDLTDETLLKLVSKVEDEQSRELLYRLNIVRTNITNKEIAIVSSCNPDINKAMEKVLQLTGIWMQRDGLNYIISPLIRRLGIANLQESLVYDINVKLGNQLLSKGTLSQYDVQHVVIYFNNSKQFDKAGFVILNYLKHCLSKPSWFFDWNFDLYCWYYFPLPSEMHLTLRLYIRSIHLNLESFKPTGSKENLEFLRKDLISLVDQAISSKIDVYFPALVLSSSYIKDDSALAAKYFSYYINSSAYRQLPEIASENLIDFREFDNNIIWLLLFKIDTISALNQWFTNFKELSKPVNETTDEQSFFFCDNLFLNFMDKEKKSESPDWDNLLIIFEQIFTAAKDLSLEILMALAVKYQIMILSEMLNNIELAENLYLQKIKIWSFKEGNVFLIGDEIGRQFYYKENYVKAEEYLNQIASLSIEKFIFYKSDTYFTLAKMVSVKDPKRANEYMEKGLSFIDNNVSINEISYIQFIGEYATSLYLIGKTEDSLIKFIEGYELLLDSFEENDFYINTQIRYGNAIGYLFYLFERGSAIDEGYTEPYLGFISKNNNLKDLYFPEKLLINIFNIIHFFEISDDGAKAEYWALKMFNLEEKYPMRIFHNMLPKYTGYLIINDLFDKAIQLQVEVSTKTNDLLLIDANQIENSNEKELVLSFQDRLSKRQIDSDFDLMMFGFNPILIYLLTKRINNKIGNAELISKYECLLKAFSENFIDKRLLNELNYLLNHFPNNEMESDELYNYMCTVNHEIFKYVQVPTYLICSIYKNSKTAIELLFVISPTFQIYEGSINISVLNPFLREFWQKNLNDHPEDFMNPIKFSENLQKTKNLKNSLQTKAIFALTAENLNYNLNEGDKLWLKEYADEYGD